MKNIGILTIYDNKNYGNRLQNFAVQEIMRMHGLNALTIKNVPYKEYRYVYNIYHLKCIVKNILYWPKKKKLHLESIVLWENLFKKNQNKYINFERFNSIINFYPTWLSQYNMKLNLDDFDYFVTGSDQVWNYKYCRANAIDFLEFSKNKPRLAISASLGISEIPRCLEKRYRTYLKKFKCISVRENTGKDIVNKILQTNNKAIMLIDPTMMITASKWRELSVSSQCHLPVRYIVKYYLGTKNKEIERVIESYAQKNNCEILLLSDLQGEEENYGPYEFLNIIDNATMVFTDSFHACIFSILFHTNFYATRRQGSEEDTLIFTRIQNLLALFKLEDRIMSTYKCDCIKVARFNIAENILQKERKRYEDYLNTNLT